MTTRRLLLLVCIAGVLVAVAQTERILSCLVGDDTAPTDREPELRPYQRLSLSNRMLLGDEATVKGPYRISLEKPQELDGLSYVQVLRKRVDAVDKHAALLASPYAPSDGIYGMIRGGRPWWGTIGYFYFGPGSRSADGPSEEARFLLNPFLLVNVDFMGLSIWNPRSFAWDDNRIGEDELRDGSVPLYCAPTSVTWWPERRRASVTYGLSRWMQDVAPWLASSIDLSMTDLLLQPINARDMGFNFLFVSLNDSHNVSQRGHSNEVVRIRSFVHLGKNCGHPRGCNNASPYQRQLHGIQIRALPARLELRLWRERPTDVTSAPDLQVSLQFE